MSQRTWLYLGAAIGSLLIAMIAGWVWLSGSGLPWVLRTVFDRAGFENVRFADARLTDGVLTLSDVSMTGVADLRIAKTEAVLGVGSLRRQSVERLHIAGVRGLVTLGQTGDGAAALPPVDTLTVDDLDVEIRSEGFAVALSGGFDAERTAAGFRIASRAAKLQSRAMPAWFVPLRLDIAALWPQADAPLDLTIKGGDDTGALAFEIGGLYAVNGGDTKLRARLFPLVLIDDVRPVESLFPAARRWVENLSGNLSGDFTITGGPGAWSGQGDAEVKQVSITAGGMRLENIDAVLAFDEILPPTLTKEQTVRIGRAVFALPFEDIVARFAYSRSGVLDLRVLEARLAEGTVRARPLSVDLRKPEGQATLTIENVSLGALLQSVDVDGLSGEGKLGGTLPITASAEALRITGGVLAADGPGRLRYVPKADPGGEGEGQMALLRQVLTDFRFTELKMNVDGAIGGEQQVTIRLVGANPTFYDGYPVAFTLNVGGALEAIVRRGVSAYALPDTLRTNIERLQKENRK